MLAALLLVASPALMLAPPAAASAHRLAQPAMQFGAQGGQTPFAPLGTAGGASSAAASGSSALGQSEVADTGEVVQKGKKRKVDPNTGMLDQDRHLPDSSGVSHVPVPSPYHVFEPRMARRSPSAAPCSTRVHDGCIVLADCTVRCNLGMPHMMPHAEEVAPPPSRAPAQVTSRGRLVADGTSKAAEEPTFPGTVQAAPSPLSLANTAATAAPKGRGGDLGATTWAGSGDLHLGGTMATTRAA